MRWTNARQLFIFIHVTQGRSSKWQTPQASQRDLLVLQISYAGGDDPLVVRSRRLLKGFRDADGLFQRVVHESRRLRPGNLHQSRQNSNATSQSLVTSQYTLHVGFWDVGVHSYRLWQKNVSLENDKR
jgi:hypothetical protein